MHLEPILAETRRVVEARKRVADFATLEARAAAHQPRGFAAALRRKSESGPAIIAELKKASPSKGLIRPEFDVPFLAKSLERGGASVLSVLTEEKFFQGSLGNLEIASAATKIPCLRKDFIVDEFQILEARAHQADAILLIAAALSDLELKQFNAAAHKLGLDVLCEVHTAEELERVADLGCDAYGVNNRDLVSFNVRLEVSLELAARLPKGAVHVAESGIHTADDLNLLRNAGFHAFLIGESLMRQADPGEALERLLAGADEANPSSPLGVADMWIKICGNTSLEDARLAVDAGANAVGFVFAESPRQVTRAQVRAIAPMLPKTIEKYGVFVDPSFDEVVGTVIESGLTGVQLHTTSDPRLALRLREHFAAIPARGRLGILRVMHYAADFDAQLEELRQDHAVDALLIDSRTAKAVGGTGVAFDWRAAQSSFLRTAPHLRLIVAGGLRPENVAEALYTLQPWGVDVASGVETTPGCKDPAKVRAFVDAVRKASVEIEKAKQPAEA